MTAATWPVGMVLTGWDYLWRSTPLHRHEVVRGEAGPQCREPEYPAAVSGDEVQGVGAGTGPLFHRRYRTCIRDSATTPEQVIEALKRNLNRAAPTSFARFQKVLGPDDAMDVGDEYVVRMPGPWDGPVRVIDSTPRSFRFATLEGHLEAGQIEFRARPAAGGELVIEIESWARSSSRLANLLYHRLRMSKEVQAHMWISFLEGVVRLAEGDMTGGVSIETERVEVAAGAR